MNPTVHAGDNLPPGLHECAWTEFVGPQQTRSFVAQNLTITDAMVPPNLYILVVDDHLGVLTMLETVLRPFGIVVLFADNGAAAVEIFREHSQTISVVLLSVNMPDLDGPQTLALLRQITPDVCCCFMSGAPGKYSEEELLALGATHCFEKPFRSLAELAATLKQVALSREKKQAGGDAAKSGDLGLTPPGSGSPKFSDRPPR